MTDEHLVALGRITLGYSLLEWTVSSFIWKLVSTDQRVGQTITASLNFSARTSLLRSLFDLLLPAYGPAKVDVKGLDAVLKQAEAAATDRNRIVHALMWVPAAEGGEFTHMNLKPRKAAEWTSAPAAVADLLRVSEQVTLAYEAVSQFMLKYFEPYGVAAWGPMSPGSLFGLMAQAALGFQRMEERDRQQKNKENPE